jgi:nucleotide-binding universal stress UspA family protein
VTNTRSLKLALVPPVAAGPRAVPVIVVGVDGSPTSWDAFSWAAAEATRTHAKVIALYATPVVEPGAGFGAPISYAAAEQARDELVQQLKDETEQRARQLGVQASFVRDVGDAASALTRFSESVHADLIVVGKSSKVLHHLAGSLGRRLVSRHGGPAIVVVP